jgi:hypothetical protein
MLQNIKYPVGTEFKIVHGESKLKVLKIDGKGANSMITLKYTEGAKEGVYVKPISEIDRYVGFKSWEQLNNKVS